LLLTNELLASIVEIFMFWNDACGYNHTLTFKF